MIVRGLGSTIPNSTLISTGLTTATAVGGATGATASLLSAIGIEAEAVPVVGTIVGGIALVISALGLGNGCGATCTESTQVVNKIAPLMQQNLDAANQQAQANGGCLTQDEVTTLENSFNQLWNYVLQSCQQIGGPGGSNCIKDRSPGGKYDWASYYLTPIQKIPVCNVSSVSSLSNLIPSSSGLNLSTILLFGGIGLVGLLLLD